MEWLVLLVLVGLVVNKLSRLKSLRLEWGLLHLEFDVSPKELRPVSPSKRIVKR